MVNTGFWILKANHEIRNSIKFKDSGVKARRGF
jgi:hypothetical protein